MKPLRMLLLALVLPLAACDETRFTADPLGEARACEPGLAGTWRIEDDGDGAPEFVHLEADCDLRLLRAAPGGEGGLDLDAVARRTVSLSPSIGRVDGTLYLSLTDEDFHRAANDEGGDTGHPEASGGFHVYRIELRGESAQLRGVDHRAVAHALIDGKLNGQVRKDDEGLKNLVQVDEAAGRALLRKRWLFRRDQPLRLQRVRAEDLPPGIRRQVGAQP